MPPPAESPFKRDEPVASSAKWIRLAALGAALWAIAWGWRTIGLLAADTDAALDTLWQLAVVGVIGTMAWLLFKSGQAAAQCRTQRSFEIMGAALRTQRLFWAILTVSAGAGTTWLVFSAVMARDYNGTLRRWIEQHRTPPPDQQPAAASQP